MAPAAPRLCSHCQTARAVLKRPKNHDQLCRECFYAVFEEEVHQTVVSHRLFRRGERVALAASGGKDSTVLAHVITTLNKRYDYGLDLFLLSIDEGISGYRDDSLETVKRNEQTYGIPLVVVSYKQLYDWTMDEIVSAIGTKNNCTFCGVFRRQALDRGAVLARADKIATGHNADDVAETVLLNILRGDVPRLGRCASAMTGEDGGLPRVKPFKYSYEKEIVMYAYFKKLDYFSTECVYAPFAARGFARDFVKDLEAARPSAILDIIRSAEHFAVALGQPPPAHATVSQQTPVAATSAVIAVLHPLQLAAQQHHQQTQQTEQQTEPTHVGSDALPQPPVQHLPQPPQQAPETTDSTASGASAVQGPGTQTVEAEGSSCGIAGGGGGTQSGGNATYTQAMYGGGARISRAASGAPSVGTGGGGGGGKGGTGGGGGGGGSSTRPQQVPKQCERCGYLTSQPVCKACVLLEGLNRGRPGKQSSGDEGAQASQQPQEHGPSDSGSGGVGTQRTRRHRDGKALVVEYQ